MLETIDLENLDQVNDQLFTFVWDFKHGDNISYNLRVLAALYAARVGTENKDILNKPITIAIVSIVEAILIDFLTRIDGATTHLPANVDRDTLDKIKLVKGRRAPKIFSKALQRVATRAFHPSSGSETFAEASAETAGAS